MAHSSSRISKGLHLEEIPATNHLEEPTGEAASERAHSFIVKVWLEEVADKSEQPVWRGLITHVPGGERRYLQNLNEVAQFITPYLHAMGVRTGIREWIKRWLTRY